ncbi:MAG: hypothetical protein KA327_00885 [Pseudarcicella sp.]|nr:hypothetical protein [Pseudarcicella sp.]
MKNLAFISTIKIASKILLMVFFVISAHIDTNARASISNQSLNFSQSVFYKKDKPKGHYKKKKGFLWGLFKKKCTCPKYY